MVHSAFGGHIQFYIILQRCKTYFTVFIFYFFNFLLSISGSQVLMCCKYLLLMQVTYRRMKDALIQLSKGVHRGPASDLIPVLFGERQPAVSKKDISFTPYNRNLDQSQVCNLVSCPATLFFISYNLYEIVLYLRQVIFIPCIISSMVASSFIINMDISITFWVHYFSVCYTILFLLLSISPLLQGIQEL